MALKTPAAKGLSACTCLVMALQTGCAPSALDFNNAMPPHDIEVSALETARRGADGPPPKFDATEQIERFALADAGTVIHFSRLGRNQIPATDNDDGGVPDFVELAASTYQHVADDFHLRRGFRVPLSDANVPGDNGGDGRFDVYLVDFALRADGAFRQECFAPDTNACPGHVLQENDFVGYGYASNAVGTRIVSSHEYFHAVQQSYGSPQNVVLSEGTAVWATEVFDATLDDFERFAAAYLAAPERPLDQEPSGPVDSYAYGTALFFECLSQFHGEDTVRRLFEMPTTDTKWLKRLQSLLSLDEGASLRNTLRQCFDFNLFTGSRARQGYGHRRAERLPEAPVGQFRGLLSIDRVPLFTSSSRYWQVSELPSDAMLYWEPVGQVALQNESSVEIRTTGAALTPPAFSAIPPRAATPIGGGAVFVLASHVGVQMPSIPIRLCAGSPAFVQRCALGADAGSEEDSNDAGLVNSDQQEPAIPAEASRQPDKRGCSASSFGLLALLAGAVLSKRRRSVKLLILLMATKAAAQQAVAPPQPIPIDAGVAVAPDSVERTTVVTGARVSQALSDTVVSTELLTRRQIVESGARDLAEALQARAGIEMVPNVGNVGLRMQGLGPEYNLVLINGQRTTGRINGGIDVSRVSAERIEQVEIVKGPSSVLWGSDALAGTVNIITRKPQKPLGASTTVSYGLPNQFDFSAEGEAIASGWGVSVNGGYRSRQPFDYDIATAATNVSGLTQAQGSLAITRGKSGSGRPSGELTFDFTRRSQTGIDSNAAGAVLDRTSRDNIFEARASGSIPISEGAITVSLGGSLFDRRFIVDQRNAVALDSVQDTADAIIQWDAQVAKRLGKTHHVLGGGQVLVERLYSPRLNTGFGTRARGALFIQDEWTVLRSLSLVAGLRLDNDSGFGAALTPRLSARAEPHSTVKLRLNTGLGFRAPSFQELLLDFENPSVGYVVVGNAALRPERSYGTSLHAEWTPHSRVLVSGSVFWNELWDMIGFASELDNETIRFRYVNLARVRSRGLETSIQLTLVAGLALQLGYTLTDARNLSENRPLDGQSMHRFFGLVRYRHRPWGLTGQLRWSVTGPRPLSEGDALRFTSSYGLLDARIAKTIINLIDVFIAGTNLLQSGNANNLPIPPRSIFAGITGSY